MSDRKLELEDRGDFVAVGLQDDEITRCYVDYQFSLLFAETGALVVIEQEFSILGAHGEQRFDPEKWAGLGSALESLLFKKVAEVKAHRSGELEITFTHGDVLRVMPNADYEAWHVVGTASVASGDHASIVCMPGGELAIWGMSDPNGRVDE